MKPTRPPLLALCSALALAAASPAQERRGADDGGRLVVTGAQVDGFDAPVTILVAGGKVRAIGPDVRAPRGTPRLDAGGARVVPGRIEPVGDSGGMNTTDLAPKIVLLTICTVALEGMCLSCLLSMASLSLA